MTTTTKGARAIAGRSRKFDTLADLRSGTAIAGAIALGIMFPASASAQSQCGVPADGEVTCGPDGNTYPTGIIYNTPADLTLNLESGVVVETTLPNAVVAFGQLPDVDVVVNVADDVTLTSASNGIVAQSQQLGGTATVDNAGNIDAATRGIIAVSNGDSSLTNSGDITMTRTSTSNFSTGLVGISNAGDVVIVNSGDITVDTNNATAQGIYSLTSGVDSTSTVTNSGAISITNNNGAGFTRGAILFETTNSPDASISFNSTGAISVTSVGRAEGVAAFGGGDIDIDVSAPISVEGTEAFGIRANSRVGDLTIAAGDITVDASAANSAGISAIANLGSVAIDAAGSIAVTGDGARGIVANGATGVTITGGGDVLTTGDNANAVEAFSATGPVDLTVGDISTSGEFSGGVRATGGIDSDVSVTTGNVTTSGTAGSNYSFLPNSTAIVATAQGTGNVSIDAGDISTAGLGAAGVNATAALGDVSVTTGDVTTLGDRANGVSAQSTAGDVAVTTGTIATSGTNSTGVYAVARAGGVSVDAGAITTEGFNARGIDAIAGAGGVDVAFTSVEVGGDFSSGISAISTGGDVVVSGADVTTTGTINYAIYASSDVGNVDVTTTGDVSSTGRGSAAIFAYSATGDVSVNANNVSVAAADEADVDTTRGAIVALGANVEIVVTGTVSTTGSALYGGSADAILVAATNGDASVSVVDVSTTGDNADAVDVVATGSATVDATGSITTTGDGSRGIVVLAGEAATITGGGDVATEGDNAFAVSATSSGGPVSVTVGDVSTAGGNSDGISVRTVADFDATVVAGDVTTTDTGFGSRGVSVLAADGDISVTTGNVSTAGLGAVGIYASSAGGFTTVDAGDVSTSGSGNAILARGGQGVDVSFTGASTVANYSTAVSAITSGPVTINGGDVSTTGTGSDGITAISFDDDVVVTTTGAVTTSGDGARGVFAQAYAGDVTVSVNDVATTGDDANAVLVSATGGDADVTVTGTVTTTGVETDAVVVTSDQAVTVTNSGSINGTRADSSGIVATSVDGTTIVNSGTLRGGDYALVVNGGPATVTNSGTLSGRILLTDGDDTLSNSGRFVLTGDSDFGAGTDSLTNTGTITTGLSSAGTVRLLGLETLTSSGLIELRNDRTGDILSTSGNFVGTGGNLGVDVNLANGTSDRFVVGGSATGSTTVLVDLIGTGPVVLGTNILIVDAGAGSSAGAFTLSPGTVDQGLVQLGISFDAANNNFNLVSAPGAAVFRTGAFAGGLRNLWLQSADAWSAQTRAVRDNVAANGGGDTGGRVWAQGYGQMEEFDATRDITVGGTTTTADIGTEQDYFGGQMGIDLGGSAGEGGFAFGVTGGYLNSNVNFNGTADRINYDVANVGAYASYTSGTFFLNALGKYDRYWGDVRSATGRYETDLDGSVYGTKAEVGLRLGGAFWVEPAASIAYTKVDIDDFDVAQGGFRFDAEDGLLGKAGARIGTTFGDENGTRTQVYIGGNYVHEFEGRDTVSFVSGGQTVTFTQDRPDDYGEGTLGINIGSRTGTISGFFEGRYATGGDYDGFGARGGIRFRF